MPDLSISNLSVPVGGRTILDHIDLQVPAGQTCVLLGTSGSGKSTLLRAVAGLVQPSSGRVMIGGLDVTSLTPGKRGDAMVFQSYALYPRMTVAENIGFGLKIRGCDKIAIHRQVHDVANKFQVSELLGRLPSQLSGGQRQRVALARAIIGSPSILLLDEPLASLDTPVRGVLREELLRLKHNAPRTTLLVTHDFVEAMTLGDTVAVLSDGMIVQEGRPIDLYRRPCSLDVALLTGDRPINLLEGVIETSAAGFQLRGKFGAIELPHFRHHNIADKGIKVTLGLRPELVKIRESSEGGVAGFVTGIEQTGADIFARIQCGDTNLCVRSSSRPRINVHDCINIGIDSESYSMFYCSDGKSV